jgi:hypothetical protein
MGIRFSCPNGHKLHVKSFLAGKRGICPQCGARILIPSEEQFGKNAPPASPPFERQGQVESSIALAGTLTDPGSASVVIAIAESPVGSSPIVNAPTPMPTIVSTSPPAIPNTVVAPPTVASEPPAAIQPIVVTDAIEPISPAGRYVAQRERHRRKQFLFAIMLFLAVIVLAGVLVFVLLRGAGNASNVNGRPTSLYQAFISRPVAVLYDRFSNAPSALVAVS